MLTQLGLLDLNYSKISELKGLNHLENLKVLGIEENYISEING
jgi:Leucine-rich repeat (LRR) protein